MDNQDGEKPMSIQTVKTYRKIAGYLLAAFAFAMVLFHEYTTATLPLTGFMQTAMHLGLAMKALGMFRGGIAKVAVLASALFGMLSGAGPANAATTGAFTIPMMKKYGYEAPFAGAVEATASVGGQIMPPIMGASAFIMAEYLGVSYGRLVLCAFPAAILYYFAIFLAVDIEAQKRNLTGLPREEIPELGPIVKESWHLMISVAVLIVLLVFCGYGPGAAGFWATVVMAVCELVNCLVKKKKRNLKELGGYIVDCTCNASSIAVSCACAGIILCGGPVRPGGENDQHDDAGIPQDRKSVV